MKVVIRNSVFETNSSSVHSLIVDKSVTGRLNLDRCKASNGSVIISKSNLSEGEVAPSCSEYNSTISNSALTKIMYLVGIIRSDYSDKELQNLKSAIIEETKAPSVVITDDFYSCDYPGHGSADYSDIVSNVSKLRELIFNPAYKMCNDSDHKISEWDFEEHGRILPQYVEMNV